MLDGSIIATIITTQPRTNSPASPAWRRARRAIVVEVAGVRRGAPGGKGDPGDPGERGERRGEDRPISPRVVEVRAREHRSMSRPASGREAEVALQGVVALEVDAGDAVLAAVACVLARLAGVDGRARDRAEDRLGERRRVAGRADGTASSRPRRSRRSRCGPCHPGRVNVIGARSTATTSPIKPARSATAPPSCPVKSLSRTPCCSSLERSSTKTTAFHDFGSRMLLGMWADTASVRPPTSTPSIEPFSMPQAIVVSQVL